MDKNAEFVIDKQVARVISNLEKNNMNGYYVKNKEELTTLVDKFINKGDIVGIGGSMTLFETGILDHLKTLDIDYLDRYKVGLVKEDIEALYKRCFYAQSYFTSTNAITEDGMIYNVDGNGNRVAAMIWGPDKVIIICGTNKIVKDENAAIERNRRVAAPANAKRLNMKTPCAEVGYCMDCNSADRICSDYVMIKKQRTPDRIHVIFVEGSYGY